MTAICVPLFLKQGVDAEEAVAAAEEALRSAAVGSASLDFRNDAMLELRCDSATERQMLAAIDAARLPVIVTIRPRWEGGFSDHPESRRGAMLEAAMEAGAEYIDIELLACEKSRAMRDALSDAAEKNGARMIVSSHSFGGRPADLRERLTRLRAISAARILKIAWKAESLLDGFEALQMMARRPANDSRPVLALAMGEEGMVSRLLAQKFGAPFTFAAAARGQESAPGQPTAAELRRVYRWDTQNAGTRVFGVVGWPVGHSLSPHIHNAGFAAAGVNAVYVPLPVQPTAEAFTAAMNAFAGLTEMPDGEGTARGVSVTIPHKEHAFRYAVERGATIDAVTRGLGVANTLLWKAGAAASKKSPTLAALNSDYAGALDALAGAWGDQPVLEVLRGKHVAVLGAGGAARAIVRGLVAQGARVSIYNRTFEKAAALAADASPPPAGAPDPLVPAAAPPVVAVPWEALRESACDAYINCTPLGMHPKTDASPFDAGAPVLTANTVVFDTVYNPGMTRFLRQAARAARIVPGAEMFIRQAAIQFAAFTGVAAPIEVMRAAMQDALQNTK